MDIHITHKQKKISDKLLTKFYEVETTHWWWMARKKIVVKLLNKYLKNKKNKILDAGCGTGAEILYLSDFGKVFGIDTSETAITFCKKRGIKNIRVADVSQLPYQANYFDLVCLMDVIEHIKNDKKAIKEIYRVLKPDGYLLMTLPALPFIYSKHDKEQGHYKRYLKSDIRSLFRKTGFIEEKVTYFNIFLSLPIIIIRLISKIGGPLSSLADFDSKLNYDISKKKKMNTILTKIFSLESHLLLDINLPFGISLLTIHKK